MQTAMASPADAVALASSCPLPHKVAESSERHIVTADPGRVLRSERLKDAAPTTAASLSPWQATPVSITHHHAAGLSIRDDSRPEEVRGGWRWGGANKPGGPLFPPRPSPHALTPPTPQERIAAINETIQTYEKKLQERTRHHRG